LRSAALDPPDIESGTTEVYLMSHSKDSRPETVAIHAGNDPAKALGAVSVPIYQSSTFAFDSAEQGAARFAGTESGYIYTRLGNPTVAALEEAVSTLEGGYGGLGTASGMAAVTTVMLAFLKSGDHVVGTDAVYGPSRLLLEGQLVKFGIESSWVPTEDPSAIEEAIRPETRLMFVETPANPTIKLADLAACGKLAKRAGSLLVVDNTFSTPLLQRPLEYGAHVVVHSMTKYINGHGDVVAGMIVSSDEALHTRLKSMLRSHGGTMDPHQAWLVLRGLRTLPLRLEKSQANAEKLAVWLNESPHVAWVQYPGLPDHPQHDLMKRQMEGPGGVISFGVHGGLETARQVINSVKVATLAVSLGGVETLIEHPASMTHAGMPRKEREAAGIRDDLIRIAVGCEAFEDLRADLEQAIQAAGVVAHG
jgi:methionine-gamma-lyase